MIRAQSLVRNEDVDWRREQASVWVDVLSPSDEELAALRDVFPFNKLALEDALTEGQWSRFEAYPEHVFLVFRTPDEPIRCTNQTERVSFFWYPRTDTLVTVRRHEVEYLDLLWKEVEPVTHGSEEQIIYLLLAQGANTFFQFSDALQERTDELEEEMFTNFKPNDLAQRVFEYKHLILNMRRLASQAREAIAAFSRHTLIVTNSAQVPNGTISPQAQEVSLYIRDVVETLARVYETLDSSREVLSNILDVNLTVQSNRMNEVMKTLTVISSIFLPLTFLAGIWGMNFHHMPELDWRLGYPFALATMAVVAGGMIWYFRRRGWF